MHLVYTLIIVVICVFMLIQFGPVILENSKNRRLGKHSRLKLCATIKIDKITEVYILHFKKNRRIQAHETVDSVIHEEYQKAGLAHAERHDMDDLAKHPVLKRCFVSMSLSSRVSPTEVQTIHVGARSVEIESLAHMPKPDNYHYLVAIKSILVSHNVKETFSDEKSVSATAL